jgi:serine phosphatase RsbU (regulator of sigma subunit)
MGRGVSAAAAMATMRAAVRAYVAVDPTPAAVLSRLDVMYTRYSTDQLVTLVHLVVDADRGELVVANAGRRPRYCCVPIVASSNCRARTVPRSACRHNSVVRPT